MDTSVLIKWFHGSGESELEAARTLRSAHQLGTLTAHILDLAVYEVGNVLIRSLRWAASDVAAQLQDLMIILGPPLTMAPEWLADAAHLAESHELTFYDASWAAAAAGLKIPLVSSDMQLVAAGLADSPTAAVKRFGLVG